ncbi:hypothetical protein [Pandoraea commovens]|uniref:Uncharacterized protein n=1 Tax=Pandoraea commovens TaxID=2508289 RepID=A0A5E4S296_9BURK|nr:hypothetical protein [Pandoraea commovens]VVD68764.1 hypothetical protein PCO31010_00498 [Pandoraea commovens]
MTAMGSNIIQVSGDLSVTNIVVQRAKATSVGKLSRQERGQLSAWAEEVVTAEHGCVSSKIVRGALNSYLGVQSVEGITPDMIPKAAIFLNGWRNCAHGRELSNDAMVAQVMRMWGIVPLLKMPTIEFARANFNNELLRDMTVWELRATLAFTMTRWNSYWEARGV